MDSIIAIIFGIVQGLTEFIPVSSSGHLLILHEFFPGFVAVDEIAFDVALHVGTLIALFIFFWGDVVRYVRAWLHSLKDIANTSKTTTLSADARLAWLLILAMIPAGVVGGLFESDIEAWFRSTGVVITMLIFVGVLFLVVERFAPQKNVTLTGMTWKAALFIGVAQILAFIPGTSRSGITIVAGMVASLKRDDAARFSFLMSMPLITAAGLKKGLDLVTVGLSLSEIPVLLLGVVSSAVVGYLAISTLLQYLSKRSLSAFAWYRISLAAVLILVFYVV